MNQKLNILIIDNHPIIIDAFKNIFFAISKYEINLEVAKFYGQALINFGINNYDVVFIDLEMSTSNEELHISVDRVPILLKNKFPETKIVLIVSGNKPKMLFVLKSMPYDGLLIKNDFTVEIIPNVLNTILNKKKFYSPTALDLKSETEKSNISLDELDISILKNLSLGIKTKNLSQFIPLSLSAIEKRKGKIKIMFNVSSDESLLEKARKKGFV